MSLQTENITAEIQKYFTQLFSQTTESHIVISRKDVAARFGCVPSQINYVIRSRFAPENGFLIESQRGGHGYIKIMRISFKNVDEKLSHIVDMITDSISEQDARRLLVNLQERAFISASERLLIEVAMRNQDENCRMLFDVSPYKRELMRAELLKKLLTSLTLQ